MSIKVLRLDRWIDPCFDQILGAEPGVDLSVMKLSDPDDVNWTKLAEADIYHVSAAKDEVPQKWQVTPELIARCPRLKVVSSTGAGYDTVDVEACTRAGILVVNQAGGNANSVAQHTFSLLLALANRIVESDHLLKTASGLLREDLMGRELTGKVLGIVGIGHIGARVAQLACAFGMQVLACDPYVDEATVCARGAAPAPMEELLAGSDIVSLHCPRNKETLGMFGGKAFQSMKRGALFISTARGGIHDETALYTALESGHLGGAGLDVWMVEPPPHDHPLLTLPNVVSTYHTAGVTHEARRNIATISARQILDICAGRTPPRMINPEVHPAIPAQFQSAASI
ncbi:hydroxyacid dehydrogenase [Pollutimonas bauzanensis]|uniref:D-3-phosphoglycerate dehydrogenase n=1 Tax=Pollutimonas bauzanensis TaxID=658167 RepID=A0A1M5X6Y9_9BURK|nr:hydroxyacid dehydrogenase [Pollutimonas bauzanensis]SHH94993.1 D-3-phosphoglycerate dehydrogenase [Pollutimonas bauzanensis]